MYFLRLLAFFLCASFVYLSPLHQSKSDIQCPINPGNPWTYFNLTNSCYLYVGGVSWDEGEFDICQKEYHAHHVSIHSAFEDNFLYNITNPQDDEQVWLGYHSDAGVFGWSDNSAKDYFNFQNNQQPQPNGQEQCVVKNMQYGYWVVDQCSDFTSTVICKKPAYSF